MVLCLILAVPVWGGIEGEENTEEQVESDIKVWSADAPLVWSDFQAKSPNSAFAAQTVWTWQNDTSFVIQCAPTSDLPWLCKATLESAVVRAAFLKEFSWVKAGSRNNRALLAHEQGHFDLGEVYARKLNAALLEIETEAGGEDRFAAENEAFNELETVANDAVNEWIELAQQEQDRYERDTAHGVNASEQQRWEIRIRSLLVSTPSSEEL